MAEELEKFFLAIQENDLVQLNQLLTERPSLISQCDIEGRDGFYYAIEQGNNIAAFFLLGAGSNFNFITKDGWNALHLAASRGNMQILKALIDKGASLTAKTNDGLTPFHIAAFYGNTEVLNELLTRGASMNEVGGKSQWTALHLSTVNGHLSAVKFLLDRGADINSIKRPQGSCLHLAVKEKHLQIIGMLLQRGINLEITDAKGKKAKELIDDNSVREIFSNFEKLQIAHNEPIADDDSDIAILNASNNNNNNNNNNSSEDVNNNNNNNNMQRPSRGWVKPSSERVRSPSNPQFLSKVMSQQELSEISTIQKALENIQQKRESKRLSMKPPRPPRTTTYSPSNSTDINENDLQRLKRNSLHPDMKTSEYSEEAPPLWGNTALMDSQDDTNELLDSDDSGDRFSLTSSGNNNIVAYPGADKGVQEEQMVWSWLSKVAGAVIDAQAQEALEHILRLLNTLFHDRDQKRSIDALLALTLVAMKYDNKPISSTMTSTMREIEVASYYFKFACAAYGWKMLNPLMFSNKQARVLFQGLTTGDPMNRKALCEHTGIKDEDIIVAKWTSSDYHPAHYIALDHKTASLIISIRGSFHVKDALVDLIASATPFKNGFAHTGMLECARRKLEFLLPTLQEAFETYPIYDVVVVGHSLGAGTASLLTILLRDEFPKKNIRCYAYAPPCVLSAELALSCSNFIASYCLGDDCVPRLSFGSIELLKNLTTKIMQQSKSTVKLLLLIKRGKLDVNKLRSEIVTAVDDRLLPPGTVYQILRETKQRWIPPEELPKCFKMERSNPTFFSELIVSSSMFSDHLPWNYHAAFLGLKIREDLYEQFSSPTPAALTSSQSTISIPTARSTSILSSFRKVSSASSSSGSKPLLTSGKKL